MLRTTVRSAKVARFPLHYAARLYSEAPKDPDLFVAPSMLPKEHKHPDLRSKAVNTSVLPERETKGSISEWGKSIGNFLVSAFRLDMDRIRAGPIAGSHYYGICKEQGLIKADLTGALTKSAEYWYEKIGLEPTFATWVQITILHSWILFVRMRVMPFKYGKNYQQKLVDRFFADTEQRLTEEMNIMSGRIRDQYLKEFHAQMRGAVLGYDEGFYTDDITLAYAVWRNLFNAKSDVDYAALESVVRYIRMQLYVLSKMSDREFAFGKFSFVPCDEVVYRLTPEEEQELKRRAKEEFAGMTEASLKSKLSLDN